MMTILPPADSESLPLSIIGISMNRLQEPVSRPNGIPFYQLFCCTHGTGEVIIHNSRRCVIQKGQGMFLTPGTPHSYHALEREWRFDSIVFTGPACAAILQSLGFAEPDVFEYSSPETVHAHLRSVAELQASRRHKKSLLYCKEAFSLLVDASAMINRMDTQPVMGMNNTVQRAIDFIEQNYMNDIALGEIAAYAGVSNEHLCRVFRENLQETVIESLTKYRLYQACRKLRQYPDRTARSIGEECGFRSPSYFVKVFKEEIGMTPNAYRLHN